MSDEIYDAVIVGAGLAGLAAAHNLLELSEGNAKVLVLEARERPGGRVLTVEPNYGNLDLGGEFIGLIQEYAPFYAQRFNLPLQPTFLAKTHRWRYQDANGQILDFPGDNPLDFPGGANALNALGVLNQLSLSVRAHLEAPWEAPNAEFFDNMPAVGLLQVVQKLTKAPVEKVTQDIFRVSIRSAFSVEPENLSALFCLYYAAAAGSYSTLVDINGSEGAAEGTRFQLGAGTLVNAFFDSVTSMGGTVQFAETVTKVDQTAGTTATVTTNKGSYLAKHVIVALSPPIAGKIDYQPISSVCASRRRLMAEMQMGHTIKGFFAYKRPFWRQAGLMGFALAARPVGTHPIDWTLDNCFEGLDLKSLPPGQERAPIPPHPHSMMVFMAGAAADEWGPPKPRNERRAAALRQLVEIYGPEAESELLSEVENYHEFDFNDESLTGGGPTAVMPPGLLTTAGKVLRRPDGLIQWAGTEHATHWCGYMDGAIQSGTRTAANVFNQLPPPSP